MQSLNTVLGRPPHPPVADPPAGPSYEQLLALLEPARAALLGHPIYARVSSLPALQAFMTSHVFAVWDFMILLKALQQRLTCVSAPWLPPLDPETARLVNEIVLGEETDEVRPGRFMSHFDLYLEAMTEVGADTAPIRSFIAAVRRGVDASEALAELPIPGATKRFVRFTLHMAQRPTPEIAACFLLGREDVIPDMFRRFLEGGGGGDTARWASFRLYLERHIHLDEGQHAPMGTRLLRKLCGRDPAILRSIYAAARLSILARLGLWDGILQAIG